MKKYGKIILLSLLLILSGSFSYAKQYDDFDNFVRDIENISKSNKIFSEQEAKLIENNLDTYQCYIQSFDDYLYVSPVCFYDKEESLNLDFDDSLKYLYDDFIWFADEYEQDSYNFQYKSTQPFFSDVIYNKYLSFEGKIIEKYIINQWEKDDKMVILKKSTLAKFMFRRYSFYVVPTYLAGRGPCSLQNYRIAIQKLNGYYLNPGEQLTLNDLIKNNPKSCKGNSTKSFLFYGGSCGSSTQLFRLSLIMPYLTTVERYNHSKWWALYYGMNVMGDDAAMYQNSERLTVRNDFDVPIHFRVYEQGDYSYLVGILPEKNSDFVEIFKSVKGLKSSVFKRVFDGNSDIVDFNEFKSNYLSVTYSKS